MADKNTVVNKENWLQTAGKSIKKGWNLLWGRHTFEPKKMNRIDRYHYNLGKLIRSVTHLMFATLTFCAIGFSTKALGSVSSSIDTSTAMGQIEKVTSYAPAFLGSTIVYGIPYGIFSRLSVRKPMQYDTSDPNAIPIPKKYGFKTVFVVISLIPLIIWCVGQIVYIFVKKDWIKANAEYWIKEKGYENISLDNYKKGTRKYKKMAMVKSLIDDYNKKRNEKIFAENVKVNINNGQQNQQQPQTFSNSFVNESVKQVKELVWKQDEE